MLQIPKELLFPCVTGSFDYNDRQAVRDLIYSGIQLKGTCKLLNERIEQCWKEVLKESPSFILNWIENKPKITKVSLKEMLNASFCLAPENLPDSVPRHWTSEQDIHTYITDTGAAFINAKLKQFLGEIPGKFIHKPIFYKNMVFLLEENKLRLYEMESLIRKEGWSFDIGKVVSIDLFNDHLVFLTHDHNDCRGYKIWALPIHNPSRFITRNFLFPYQPTFKFFEDRFIVFWEATKGLACLSLSIQDNKLEYKTHSVERKYNTEVEYTGSYFLMRDYDLEHTVTAIANKTFIYAPTQKGFGQLAASKVLCSGKMKAPLQFQVPSVKEGAIELTPLEISNTSDYTFNRLDCAYAHLDKIFLIGVSGPPKPTNQLVILDLKSSRIENKYLLNLDMRPTIIAAELGCLYILNRLQNNILQIKYGNI